MAKVYRNIKEGETVESLLRRFKQQVKRDDIIYEVRRREFFVSKALARKMKSDHARKFKKKNKKSNSR